MTTPTRLLTTKERAARERRSERTIQRERAAGTGCPYVKIGRLVLYREDDVDAFIKAHLRRSTSEPDALSGGGTPVMKRRDVKDAAHTAAAQKRARLSGTEPPDKTASAG